MLAPRLRGLVAPGMAGSFRRSLHSSIKPYGRGGRHSVNERTVAVFGATGFLGKMVTSMLGSQGTRCYLPTRGSEYEVRDLKVMFDLGQCYTPYAHMDDEDSVREAIGDSDTIVNCVGKYYETRHLCYTRREDGSLSNVNCSYHDVNVKYPALLAKLAAEAGIERFVHVSALAADPNSRSEWARTKYEGELAVKEAFPSATIVRPGRLFGRRDRFLNWIIKVPVPYMNLPMIEGGQSLVQPVYAADVAQAIVEVVNNRDPFTSFDGKVLELTGTDEYTWEEIYQYVADVTGFYTLRFMPMSGMFAENLGKVMEKMPTPTFTEDDALQMQEDCIATNSPDVVTLADLGIEPAKLEEKSYNYLYQYRKGGHFTSSAGYH